MKNPIQPLVEGTDGIIRFKSNKIVEYLLNNGNISMNDVARLDFSKDDRQQFAQLIGYSLSGYSDLSYVDEVAYKEAEKVYKTRYDHVFEVAYKDDGPTPKA